MKKTRKKWQKVHANPFRSMVVGLFVVVFGAIGVIVLHSSFAAYGTELRISAIVGLPGNPTLTFTTSNHSLGTCDTPESPSFTVTGGISCMGNTIGNSTSDPVYLYAPANPVAGYAFDSWGGQCVATSGTRCTIYVPVGSSYDIYPIYKSTTPPAPSLNLTLSASSVAYGGSVTVNWTTNPSSASCTNNFGASASARSFVASNLTANKSFTVTCSAGGPSTSSTKAVTVGAQQQSPSGGGGSGGGGGGSSSGGGSSGGGSTAKPKTPVQSGSGGGQAAGSAADKTPPSVPGNFQALVEEDRPVVSLTWDAASDDTVVQSYQLERSLDQQTWQEVSAGKDDKNYTDTDTKFQTHYYYRLRAYDGASNTSGYAFADVTTLAFKANITKDAGGTITSEDQLTTVIIPAGAISEDATCSLEQASTSPSGLKGYSIVRGPYEIVCKTASDSTPDFSQPLTANANISNKEKKQYAGFRVYTGKDGEWSQAGTDPQSITLDGVNQFAVYGKHKTTPVWVKFLIVLVLLAAIAGGVLAFLSWRVRQKQKNIYDDYYNKERGY